MLNYYFDAIDGPLVEKKRDFGRPEGSFLSLVARGFPRWIQI
jgi:hypothetical protein